MADITEMEVTPMNNYSGSSNILELKKVTQVYKTEGKPDFTLFNELDFAIEDKVGAGQIVAVMGESGCGKSTILRYLTGLQTPTSGEICYHGRPLTSKDTIPMVFQMTAGPSTLEWYTVLQNVALPLILKGVSKAEANERAMEMIKVVGLEGHEGKYAKSPLLSGGQLQRVAIARSLVANPEILILDEPFSALDSANRLRMQYFLSDLFKSSELKNLNPTIILVTHDAREAVFLAHDILVMGANPGHVKEHIKVNFDKRDKALRLSDDFLKLAAYVENVVES